MKYAQIFAIGTVIAMLSLLVGGAAMKTKPNNQTIREVLK